MNWKPALEFSLIVLLSLGILMGAQTLLLDESGENVEESQQGLQEAAESGNLEACRQTKQNLCMVDDELSRSSYSEGCFEEGKHILENPYNCSEQ